MPLSPGVAASSGGQIDADGPFNASNDIITHITTTDPYAGPDLYYYEVIECGRRILLTEVLIFIAPNTSIQAAMACIFAFVSLLGFELTRPHADPADSWLYRLVSRGTVG